MDRSKNIFFLGIGGIGMSALARYLEYSGHKISGYDRDKTTLTKKLEAQGIKIQYEFDETKLENPIDIVVYTPAIKPDQPEYQYFSDRKIKMLKRSEMLKEILNEKKVIAIAGTHGKTTTSALLAHILTENKFSITAFVGGVMANYNSNYIFGKSEWVIVEADEYDRSFLRLHPEIALIQAIDADHLDIYGNEEAMVSAYWEFSLQIAEGGQLFVEQDVLEKRLTFDWLQELANRTISVSSFGIEKGDLCASSIRLVNGETQFCVGDKGIICKQILPGAHNIRNALGAISVAQYLGISIDGICKALASFSGIKRRFEYVFRNDEVILIDDYAHHPKEIEAAIETARKSHPDKKLTVVFQPHLYTRTRDFLNDFAISLSLGDEVILVELFPAREKPIEGINSIKLLSLIPMEEKIFIYKKYLAEHLGKKKRQLILLLGAGDVYKHIEEIKEVLST